MGCGGRGLVLEGEQQDLGWIHNAWTALTPSQQMAPLGLHLDRTTTRLCRWEFRNRRSLVNQNWDVKALDTYHVPAIAIASQWANDVDLEPRIRGNLAIGACGFMMGS